MEVQSLEEKWPLAEGSDSKGVSEDEPRCSLGKGRGAAASSASRPEQRYFPQAGLNWEK